MKILLIDLTNLAYRYVKTKAQFIPNKLAMTVGSFAKSFQVDKVIVSRDTSKSKFRKELYPEYKANRGINLTAEEQEERLKFYQAIADTCEVLKDLEETLVIEEKDIETDDVLNFIVKNHPEHEYTLISGDSDLLQLGVPQFSPVKNAFITLEDEGAKDIQHYLLAKCIAGDSSDNIDGVPGVGMKTAYTLLEKYKAKTLDELIAGISKVSPTKRGKRENSVVENEEVIRRNERLINLDYAIPFTITETLISKIDNFIKG